MPSTVASLVWSIFFVALALGSIAAADHLFQNYSSVLGGSYGTFRGPISWAHMAIGVAVAVAMQFVKSPYGRHASTSTATTAATGGKGKKQKAASPAVSSSGDWATLPAWVAWMVQESPTLIAFLYFGIKSGGASIRANPALLLFATHYFNRTILFPFFLGSGTPVRVWVCFSALGYCIFNGMLQNGIEDSVVAANKSVSLENPVMALAGAALFFGGMYANIAVDKYLTSMKQRFNRYVIPQHWIFTTLNISCPNFFCEFLEWVGFAVCTAGCCGVYSSHALAAASFAVFTAANTFPRGVQHHQWYLEKFGQEEYGALGRKAVIPFLL